MAASFVFDPKQRFVCRDCPGRCCKLPGTIELTADEQRALLEDSWARERLGAEGAAWVQRGIMPMRERARELCCVFLDEDDLCGLQKARGHDALPSPCQAFPFGFLDDEAQRTVVLLSRLCPSIRDSTGELLDERRLRQKLRQRKTVERMATVTSTVGRRILSRPQYLKLVRVWSERLTRDESPVSALAHLYDITHAFEEKLAPEPEKPDDAAVEEALAAALEVPHVVPSPEPTAPFHARSLFAYLLGNLSYPARVLLPHRIARPGVFRFMAARGLVTKLKWLRERGSVDLLYVDAPVPLARVAGVARFLGQAEGRLVRDFLHQVLERRHLLSQPRYLREVLVDLVMAAVTISRFARCRAAALGRQQVVALDVAEGIGVAELTLVSHASLKEQGRTLRELRRSLLVSRDHVHALLGTEA